MTTVTFDTLKFVERLKATGVPEAQAKAMADGLILSVCHFPPGTSKWNKIEHRMFCHITENWRGKPLVNHAVVVNLIGSTQTQTGLRIQAEVDTYFI